MRGKFNFAALEIKLEPIDFEQTVILESPLSPLCSSPVLGAAVSPVMGSRVNLSLDPTRVSPGLQGQFTGTQI